MLVIGSKQRDGDKLVGRRNAVGGSMDDNDDDQGDLNKLLTKGTKI